MTTDVKQSKLDQFRGALQFAINQLDAAQSLINLLYTSKVGDFYDNAYIASSIRLAEDVVLERASEINSRRERERLIKELNDEYDEIANALCDAIGTNYISYPSKDMKTGTYISSKYYLSRRYEPHQDRIFLYECDANDLTKSSILAEGKDPIIVYASKLKQYAKF